MQYYMGESQEKNVILHFFFDWHTMGGWRLNDYYPEPGVNPVQEWYDGQDDLIRSEFDVALITFAALDDWTNAVEVSPLTGKYSGLYGIHVDVPLPNDSEINFMAIGAWQLESPNFVLFMVSEKRGDDYDPPLNKALEYKSAWEQGKGEIHEHQFV